MIPLISINQSYLLDSGYKKDKNPLISVVNFVELLLQLVAINGILL